MDHHKNYIELMGYLEQYKDFICYESNGVLPRRKGRNEDEDPAVAMMALNVDDIWPVETEGPRKGLRKHTIDNRGKIVVDPVGNIKKEVYLLDYNMYHELATLKEKCQNAGDALDPIVLQKIEEFTQKEKKRIKALFTFKNRKPLFKKGPPLNDGRIKPF